MDVLAYLRRADWPIELLVLSPVPGALATTQTLFGPERFTRTATVIAPYTLHIVNGNPNAESNCVAIQDAVSSGRVFLEGGRNRLAQRGLPDRRGMG